MRENEKKRVMEQKTETGEMFKKLKAMHEVVFG